MSLLGSVYVGLEVSNLELLINSMFPLPKKGVTQRPMVGKKIVTVTHYFLSRLRFVAMS